MFSEKLILMIIFQEHEVKYHIAFIILKEGRDLSKMFTYRFYKGVVQDKAQNEDEYTNHSEEVDEHILD